MNEAPSTPGIDSTFVDVPLLDPNKPIGPEPVPQFYPCGVRGCRAGLSFHPALRGLQLLEALRGVGWRLASIDGHLAGVCHAHTLSAFDGTDGAIHHRCTGRSGHCSETLPRTIENLGKLVRPGRKDWQLLVLTIPGRGPHLLPLCPRCARKQKQAER